MSLQDLSNEIKFKSEKFAGLIAAMASLLWRSPLASNHLSYIRNRLSDKSIKNFNIGYFPDNLNLGLLTNLIQESVIYDLDLLYDSYYFDRGIHLPIKKSRFHYHNLIFPFSDEYGNVISLSGRTLLSKEEQKELGIPKYKNSKYKKQYHLYGYNRAKGAIEKANAAIVVEGQIDCIKCHDAGFENTVALTGSEMTMAQAFILRRRTDTLHLLLDNDAAGIKAQHKIKENFSNIFNIKIISLPKEYNDIDDYLTNSKDFSPFDI